MTHEALLHTDRRTDRVEPRAESVPEAVSAKAADTGCLRRLLVHAPHLII